MKDLKKQDSVSSNKMLKELPAPENNLDEDSKHEPDEEELEKIKR